MTFIWAGSIQLCHFVSLLRDHFEWSRLQLIRYVSAFQCRIDFKNMFGDRGGMCRVS